MPFDLNSAVIKDSGSCVTTINVGAKSITQFANSASTTSANVEIPYTASPDFFEITFNRSFNGTWFDDDFTDSSFQIYLFPGVSTNDINYSPTNWHYNRPRHATKETIVLLFKRITPSIVEYWLYTGSTYSNLIQTEVSSVFGPWDGSKKIKILCTNVSGYIRVDLFENDNLISYHQTLVPYNNTGTVVLHHHNYSLSANEFITNLNLSSSFYQVIGNVKINGHGVRRRINIYDRVDGSFLGGGFSDPHTGEYIITVSNNNQAYAVILEDDSIQKHQSKVIDFITPSTVIL